MNLKEQLQTAEKILNNYMELLTEQEQYFLQDILINETCNNEQYLIDLKERFLGHGYTR